MAPSSLTLALIVGAPHLAACAASWLCALQPLNSGRNTAAAGPVSLDPASVLNYQYVLAQNVDGASLVSSDVGLFVVATSAFSLNSTVVYALNSTTLSVVWSVLIPSDDTPPSIVMIDSPAGSGSVMVQVNDPGTRIAAFYLYDLDGVPRDGYPSRPTNNAIVRGSVTVMGDHANVMAFTAPDGAFFDLEVFGAFLLHPNAGCSIGATSADASRQYCACAPSGPGVQRPTAVCGFSAGPPVTFNTSLNAADASAYISLMSVDALTGFIIVYLRQPQGGVDVLAALYGDTGGLAWATELPWDASESTVIQIITGSPGFVWVIANTSLTDPPPMEEGSGIAAVFDINDGTMKSGSTAFRGYPITLVAGTDPETLYALTRRVWGGNGEADVWLSTVVYSAPGFHVNITLLNRAPAEFDLEASYLAVGPAQGQLVALSKKGVATWIQPPVMPSFAPWPSATSTPSPPFAPNASQTISTQFFASRRCDSGAGAASNYSLTSGSCAAIMTTTGTIGVMLNTCDASSPVASLSFWPSPSCSGGAPQTWLVPETGACYDTGFLGISLPQGCASAPTPTPLPLLLQISTARDCSSWGGASAAVNESMPLGECVDVELVGLGMQLASCDASVAIVHYFPQTDCSSTAYTWRVPTDGSCLDVGFGGVSVPLGSCTGPHPANGTVKRALRPSASSAPSKSRTPSATVHSPSVTPSPSFAAPSEGLWVRMFGWAFGR